RHLVQVSVAAPRAKGLAIVFRKTQRDEPGVGLVVGKTMDTLEAERPCLWREKKMLRVGLLCLFAAKEECIFLLLVNRFVLELKARPLSACLRFNRLAF